MYLSRLCGVGHLLFFLTALTAQTFPKARNQFYKFPSIYLIAYSRVHLNFATAKILSATAVETLEIDCCQEKKLQHTAVLVSDMVGRNLARTVIGHD